MAIPKSSFRFVVLRCLLFNIEVVGIDLNSGIYDCEVQNRGLGYRCPFDCYELVHGISVRLRHITKDVNISGLGKRLRTELWGTQGEEVGSAKVSENGKIVWKKTKRM